MSRAFPIAGAGPAPLILMTLLTAALLGGAVFVATLPAEDPAGRYIGAAVFAGVAVLFGWLTLRQSRSALLVDGEALHVRVPLYGRTIPLADIDPARIERVDLNERHDYRLKWRTNGVGLPGYRLGWYRSRERGKVLAAVTGDVNVAIPVADEYTVLATVDSVAGVIDALRRARGG